MFNVYILKNHTNHTKHTNHGNHIISALFLSLRLRVHGARLGCRCCPLPILLPLPQCQNLLVYDKTWGGVVTNDGLNDVNADFGNAWYNDHTYHYGYVLYAVAVLAKFQPYFYSMHKKQIDFLVADVADDGKRAQKFFPKARQKVMYGAGAPLKQSDEHERGKEKCVEVEV